LVVVLAISKPPPLFVQLLPNETLRRCSLSLASFPAASQQLHLGFRAALLPAPAPPLVLGPRVVRWLLEHFECCDGSASTLATTLQVRQAGQSAAGPSSPQLGSRPLRLRGPHTGNRPSLPCTVCSPPAKPRECKSASH
jgi:hypothetical protein